MGYIGDFIIVRKLNRHGTITIIAAIIFDLYYIQDPKNL